jgi:hypothetical protein
VRACIDEGDTQVGSHCIDKGDKQVGSSCMSLKMDAGTERAVRAWQAERSCWSVLDIAGCSLSLRGLRRLLSVLAISENRAPAPAQRHKNIFNTISFTEL